MILTIAFVLLVFIGIVIYGRCSYPYGRGKEDKLIPKLKESLLGDEDFWIHFGQATFLIVGAAILILFAITNTTEKRIKERKVEIITEKISSNEIYALQDNQYLSLRNQNQMDYYYTIEEAEGRGKQMQKYSSAKSYIIYISKKEQPHVEEVKVKIKNIKDYIIYAPTSVTEYYFYIPEGSILEEYNVDLQ